MNKDEINYIFERSCLRKSQLSEAAANNIIDKMVKEKVLLFYYKCPFCCSFHLTSKEPNNEIRVKVI